MDCIIPPPVVYMALQGGRRVLRSGQLASLLVGAGGELAAYSEQLKALCAISCSG